jgi:hypothetical protein
MLGRMIACDHAEQGGLAGSVAADQANARAGRDLRRGALKDEAAANAYGKIIEGQHRKVLAEPSRADKRSASGWNADAVSMC